MPRLRLLFAAFAAATLIAAPTGGASLWGPWKPVHIHLNAYAHWGHCYVPGKIGTAPEWDNAKVNCTGMGELGMLSGKEFLAHSSKATFLWDGDYFHAGGHELDGRVWGLEGFKSKNFHEFTVTNATINGVKYETGPVTNGLGGPLLVTLNHHKYFSGGVLTQGFSLNLKGWLREKK